MRLKDEEILKNIATGNWTKVFPRNLYKTVIGWLSSRKEKVAAIRAVFRCSVNKKRFACYILCSTNTDNGVQIKAIHAPSADSIWWEKRPEKLLAVPPNVYHLPMFSLPSDILAKARRKHAREKKKEGNHDK